jgi:hypothetical protein
MVSNLELRTKVLGYSLELEKAVNFLLLLNLGIYDGGKKTRLFGSKASISFKNKIDLLYDIDVLSKEENSDLELLSIFRNKFVHDMESDSMLTVLKNLDAGLVNKFRSYLEVGGTANSESECESGLTNLYLKNIVTIKKKIKHLRLANEKKARFLKINIEQNTLYIDTYYDFIGTICEEIENSDLENISGIELSEKLFKILNQALERFNNDDFKELEQERINLINDSQIFTAFLGIKKMPEEAKKMVLDRLDELQKSHPKINM